jgi:hypothetical protein
MDEDQANKRIKQIREGDRLWRNDEEYKKEAELASSILRRNRYSTTPPYQWYGPDPEPKKDK